MGFFDFFKGKGKKAATPANPFGKGFLRGQSPKDKAAEDPMRRWEGMPDAEGGDLLAGELLGVHSSNVDWVQYDPEWQNFMVQFYARGKWVNHSGSGRKYLYHNVTRDMIEDFLRAGSKGVWVYRTLTETGWPFTEL